MSAVHLKIDGPVATLTLDNPSKLNAFTPSMLADLEAHCVSLEREDAVLGVLLMAEPAKAFCAGADIKAWQDIPPAEFARHWVRDGHRIFDRLARLSKPTAAALGAHAFGGGLELAAACDLRVMAPKATISLPETHVGIVPGWSGTQRLVRLLPEPVIKEMALFGRRISADRAYGFGFAAEISDDPEGAARAILDKLTATSPRATEVAKYMIHAGVGEDRPSMIEALASGMVAATADRAEGVTAFAEKRTPEFPGS
ncbi:enoyl-CoA hydratase/isomerase family protein [Roseibium marinum]|uniref:Enoyl-CoA hydratase/carnithine racemase n=1 Tax=Roseibium marinum TaxID=281252 RepID=A0A2S3UT28_9HYPH|nr:enoyl-CoA hydratase/isomerase family protein [Roseibium marinum]POF30875.1 enoyl-CoA hydratase/carnithine racemase [Roseibium marinum]